MLMVVSRMWLEEEGRGIEEEERTEELFLPRLLATRPYDPKDVMKCEVSCEAAQNQLQVRACLQGECRTVKAKDIARPMAKTDGLSENLTISLQIHS